MSLFEALGMWRGWPRSPHRIGASVEGSRASVSTSHKRLVGSGASPAQQSRGAPSLLSVRWISSEAYSLVHNGFTPKEMMSPAAIVTTD